MQTATVDEKGTQFAYLDSGAVKGNVYTTLVIVHGHSYHAQNFRKLLPLAPQHNLRIVALNRRDYIGSTPLRQDELSRLNSSNAEDHKAYLKDRGLELAQFLAWFIRRHGIPKASDDGISGGMAVMGWSSGNITTLAMLSNLELYPPEITMALEPYLRTYILYEPPHMALGYTTPDGYVVPVIGEDANGVFGQWVSSYYDHPDMESRKLSGLHIDTPTSPHRLSTNETIAPEELLSMIDLDAPRLSEDKVFLNISMTILHDQTRRALLDAELASRFLPKLKATSLVFKETTWNCIYCAWELEKEVKQLKDEDVEGRKVSFAFFDSGNHFMHWEEPDRALMIFASIIRHSSAEA